MRCPYCQSEILDGAVVCMHCNRDFAVLAPLLRGVEHLRKAADLEIHQLRAEVETIAQRVSETEARLPDSLVPFSSRRPLAVAGLTTGAVAAASAVSWEIEDTAISEPLLLLSFALAPVVAGLVGAGHGIGARKTSLFLGAGAALAILVVQWMNSGFAITSSWPALAVLVATPAATVTGRMIRDGRMIKGVSDRSEPTAQAAVDAAGLVARSWPAVKPLITALVPLVPVLAGFASADNTQETQADEVKLEENVEEKEERAQVFVSPSMQPTSTTTTMPATGSTPANPSIPDSSPSPPTDEPEAEVATEPEQVVLTLDEVVRRRVLEGSLLSPLQLAADSAQAPGADDTFLTLAESDEFQQKLRTLEALDLITFNDEDYKSVRVSRWGNRILAFISGEETTNGLGPPAIETLAVGETATIADSTTFPVYLELEVDPDDGGGPTDFVIETTLATDEGDALLSLYTLDERIFIGRDDDGGEDFNARLVVCDLSPGRYLIELDRLGDIGGFEIAATETPNEAACTRN